MTGTIPETMQAVQLEENGGPLFVRQIPVPRPGPGEVLIRMAASPINHRICFFWRAIMPSKNLSPWFPDWREAES